MDFPFVPFPILETERFILREISDEDAPEIFFLRSDEVVLKYISKAPAASVEEALQWIDKITEEMKKQNSITWAIVQKGQDKLIGYICFWNIDKNEERVEIGYSLHPDYHNKGVMHEVFQPVLKFGFEKMKAAIVEAYTRNSNEASTRLLEKNGFKRNKHLEDLKVGKTEPATTVIYTRERV